MARAAVVRRISLIRRAARSDPHLLVDYGKWFFAGRHPAAPRVGDIPGAVEPAEINAFVRRTLGAAEPGPHYEELRAFRYSDAARLGGGSFMGGAEDLGELVYAVTRAVQPDAVIETGVATGVTSAYALAALADNQKGVLHSIDLPPSEMLDAGTVGAAIPSNLRSRWEYHWGSAKRLLPQVLTSTVGRRIFIHDSDHSYDHMMWELRTAWSVLSDGDAVICDDTHYHSAFVDFARSVGKEPTTFMQTQKNGTGGLLLR